MPGKPAVLSTSTVALLIPSLPTQHVPPSPPFTFYLFLECRKEKQMRAKKRAQLFPLLPFPSPGYCPLTMGMLQCSSPDAGQRGGSQTLALIGMMHWIWKTKGSSPPPRGSGAKSNARTGESGRGSRWQGRRLQGGKGGQQGKEEGGGWTPGQGQPRWQCGGPSKT